MEITDDMTVGQAKAYLREHMNKGTHCPCCTSRVQMYRNNINAAQVKALAYAHVRFGDAWFHADHDLDAKFQVKGRFGLLRYWGLVEDMKERRDDGGRRGMWRITDKGRSFLGGELIPKYAHVYRSKCYKLDGPLVSAGDCLGSKFRLDEILDGHDSEVPNAIV